LGNNSLKMKSYDNPNSAPRKYKNTELYLLPPALSSSHPPNTINQQYIDSMHAPIVNPLRKSMKIELYNDNWLRKPSLSTLTHSTIIDQPSSEFDDLAFLPHPDTPFPTTADIHAETNNNPVACKHKEEPSLPHRNLHTAGNTIFTPTPVVPFSASLSCSTNCLLFICYTPAGNMIWHL